MEQTPTASGLLYEPDNPFGSHESNHSQELLNGNNHSLPDFPPWDSKIEAAAMDPMFFASHNLGQSYHQPGISSGVGTSQIGNVSTPLASQNLGQSHNQLGSSLFESDAGSDDPRKIKKRAIDKAYRERCKDPIFHDFEDLFVSLSGCVAFLIMNEKVFNPSFSTQGKMVQNKTLKEENDSLKQMNKSLEANTSLMYKMLKDQDIKIQQLSNDLHQVKREHEKQNFLVQTLSKLLADADPMRLEIEKLKDEIASLRMNATLDSNSPRLAEENAKLRIENKALKVQNDALCEVAIRNNDNKHKQEQTRTRTSSQHMQI